MIHDVEWLRRRHPSPHDWPDLAGLVVVDSLREVDGKSQRETRVDITSLELPAERLGGVVRDHWRVENSLHWVMDMVFRDDESRVRTDNAPANFTTLKHIALNLTRRAPGKDSLRLRRKVDDFPVGLVAA